MLVECYAQRWAAFLIAYLCVRGLARLSNSVHGDDCRVATCACVIVTLVFVFRSLRTVVMALPLFGCPAAWLWWPPSMSIRKRPSKLVPVAPAEIQQDAAAARVRKRPAAAITDTGAHDTDKSGRPACERGKQRQSFCKNGCRRSDGTLKVVQTGCKGMCRACAVAAGIVEKSTNRLRLCMACGHSSGKVAQETHPTTGARYCRQCMRDLHPSIDLKRGGIKRRSQVGAQPGSRANADDSGAGTKRKTIGPCAPEAAPSGQQKRARIAGAAPHVQTVPGSSDPPHSRCCFY